eukprot:gene22435-biopygen1170
MWGKCGGNLPRQATVGCGECGGTSETPRKIPKSVGEVWGSADMMGKVLEGRVGEILALTLPRGARVTVVSAARSGHSEAGPCPSRMIRKAPKSWSSDASKERFRELADAFSSPEWRFRVFGT